MEKLLEVGHVVYVTFVVEHEPACSLLVDMLCLFAGLLLLSKDPKCYLVVSCESHRDCVLSLRRYTLFKAVLDVSYTNM